MNIAPFLSVNHSCDEALKRTKRQLLQAGLHSMQTFDLHDGSRMHHRTGACDCQMVVLLVYGKASEPVTFILRGNDQQTWLSIADNSLQGNDTNLIVLIQQALGIKMPDSILQAG